MYVIIKLLECRVCHSRENVRRGRVAQLRYLRSLQEETHGFDVMCILTHIYYPKVPTVSSLGAW